MYYLSKIKLPSGNIYQVKDKEGRIILGFSEYQQGKSYLAGEYVVGTTNDSNKFMQLYKAYLSFTSDTSSPSLDTSLKFDLANGNLIETSVSQELGDIYERIDDIISSLPAAGTTATAVGTTSSGGSAKTWSKSDHVHSISLATGDANGQVKIAGTNVSVKGLGSNAYTSTSYIPSSEKGTASGVATLGEDNKIPLSQLPDTILGQLVYGGTVNGSTGTATLSNNAKLKLGVSALQIRLTNDTATTTGWPSNEGIFYIVSREGDFVGLDLKVGDWLISTGTSWKKIDNTDAVISVNGKIGVVTIGTTTTNLSANVSGGSVSLTDGDAITYGSADVGTAINVGTSLTGTTSFNTDAIKSASCGQSFLTSGLASASLTGTKTFATSGVIMSIDSTDNEMLVFGNAGTGTVGISTTAATPTSVSISTTAATKSSISLEKTSITPAKASTKTFTPKTGATLTTPSVTISSGDTGDVEVVTGLN